MFSLNNVKCGHSTSRDLFVIHAKTSQLIKINDTIQCNMNPQLLLPGIVPDASGGDLYYEHRPIGTQQLSFFTKTCFLLPILNILFEKLTS